MILDLQELARRMLADQDARMPNQVFAEPLDLTTVQAYALQAQIARLREQRGENVIGYKIGCTSQPIQEQLGVREPIFGRIFDTECFPPGVHLSSARYANLAVEGELAVRLSRDLPGGPLREDEILAAAEVVFPVIELHHHVLRSPTPSCPELIASNGMHAGVVLADRETACCGAPQSVASLSICIEEVSDRTVQPWTMGGPVQSLRWLAARLGEFGLRLSKGQVILTGSPLRLYAVTPGNRIAVEAPPLGKSWAEVGP